MKEHFETNLVTIQSIMTLPFDIDHLCTTLLIYYNVRVSFYVTHISQFGPNIIELFNARDTRTMPCPPQSWSANTLLKDSFSLSYAYHIKTMIYLIYTLIYNSIL